MKNGYTVLELMQGPRASAPVPTQTFGAQNILGTTVPQVGDNVGNPNYAARTGNGGVDSKHVVIVALAFIVIGYLVYHLNFEK